MVERVVVKVVGFVVMVLVVVVRAVGAKRKVLISWSAWGCKVWLWIRLQVCRCFDYARVLVILLPQDHNTVKGCLFI